MLDETVMESLLSTWDSRARHRTLPTYNGLTPSQAAAVAECVARMVIEYRHALEEARDVMTERLKAMSGRHVPHEMRRPCQRCPDGRVQNSRPHGVLCPKCIYAARSQGAKRRELDAQVRRRREKREASWSASSSPS